MFFYNLIFSNLVPLLIICFEITESLQFKKHTISLDFSRTHWRCKRLIGLLLLFSIKCLHYINVGRSSPALMSPRSIIRKIGSGKAKTRRVLRLLSIFVKIRNRTLDYINVGENSDSQRNSFKLNVDETETRHFWREYLYLMFSFIFKSKKIAVFKNVMASTSQQIYWTAELQRCRPYW